MLARATAATPWGIEARPVQIEVDVHNGLPQVQIVGLADAAVRESRERVRAAIKNCGFDLELKSIIINLAPADLRKEGNHLDLAIALAMLVAHEQLPQEALDGCLICGELGLDGAIRTVRGGLAIADLGRRLACRECCCGSQRLGGGGLSAPCRWWGLLGLAEAVHHLTGMETLPAVLAPPLGGGGWSHGPDLSEVRGQETAKRALEVAAAGGHNLLFLGRRPQGGSGKTMLARRLPRLLPPLTLAEAIAVTKVHSLVAEEPPAGLLQQRPFRSPHTGTSTAGMIGGGQQSPSRRSEPGPQWSPLPRRVAGVPSRHPGSPAAAFGGRLRHRGGAPVPASSSQPGSRCWPR